MTRTESFDRKKGQILCKKYGIKANIGNEDMKKCIQIYENGQSIPIQFRKVSWFQKNSHYIVAGITTLTVMTSSIALYLFYIKKVL